MAVTDEQTAPVIVTPQLLLSRYTPQPSAKKNGTDKKYLKPWLNHPSGKTGLEDKKLPDEKPP